MKIAQIIASSINLINLTTGARYGHLGASETQDKPDGFRLELARAVKPNVQTPVAVVGKLRTGEMCDGIIRDGVADLVVVGRQLICDPEWPNKLRTGRENEVRKCLNCMDGCYSSLSINSGTRCAINPYVGFESVYDEGNLPRVVNPKKVVVIGGGVAGMQAALTAAERGHSVTLLEKNPVLGGQLGIASVPPHKDILNTTPAYYELRMRQEGVDIRLGVEADAESVAALKPDTVILATGSLPSIAPIPGIEHAVESWDIPAARTRRPGKSVVIIGGGTVGCETGLHLLTPGTWSPSSRSGHGSHRQEAHTAPLEILKEIGVDILTRATIQMVTELGVEYSDKDGNACQAEADLIVVSTGQRPVGGELAEALENMGITVKRAGDALQLGKIRFNVRSGFLAGYDA